MHLIYAFDTSHLVCTTLVSIITIQRFWETSFPQYMQSSLMVIVSERHQGEKHGLAQRMAIHYLEQRAQQR